MAKRITSLFKGELARAYGINVCTLKVWLKTLKDKNDKLLDTGKRKILNPREVELIIAEFGEPDWSVLGHKH